MGAPPLAMQALDDIGLDRFCMAVASGTSLTDFAENAGVSIGSLITWLALKPERLARARAVRQATAWYWDEKAEQEIRAAGTLADIARARELAFHYRWRASKINYRDYGDRTTISGDPENPLLVGQVAETRAQLIEKLQRMADPLTIEGAVEKPDKAGG